VAADVNLLKFMSERTGARCHGFEFAFIAAKESKEHRAEYFAITVFDCGWFLAQSAQSVDVCLAWIQ
jgi:hypothetical protein